MDTPKNKPIYSLAITWMLVVPLLYFAARGQFWFVGDRDFDANSINGTMLGAENAPSTGAGYLVSALIVFTLIFMLVLPKFQRLLALLQKDILFFALTVVAVASTAWSQFPSTSLKLSLCLAVNTVFSFYLYDKFGSERIVKLLYGFGWIAVILSLFLVVFFPRLGQISDMDLRINIWRGIYSYKNSCAIPTIFLLSLVFYLPAKGFIHKTHCILYAFLSILLVLKTQSRTGWILLGSLFVYVACTKTVRKFSGKDKATLIALGMAVTLPIVGAIYFYFEPIMLLLGKDASMSGRTNIWQAVIVSAMKRPILGYGYMGFFHGLKGENANVALQSGWNVSASHNGFLDIWVTLGAVGLAILLWSFFRAFKDSFACLLARGSSFSGWCGCVVFLMLIANLDEKAMMLPNDLVWIFYTVACLGLADAAKRIRLGLQSD